jgi:L,D-peptidoglycan transpeptidase YkuD (ErfK/YbiS/YcfS/YnhG family)
MSWGPLRQGLSVLLALSLAFALVGWRTPAGAAAVPAYHPTRLAHVGDATQLVVVTSKSWRSSHATLRTYEKGSDGRWRAAFPAMKARIGSKGFVRAKQRRQSTWTTPAGTFGIPRAFGLAGKPAGTKLRYRKVDGNDWWPYDPRDPRTYNVLQPFRPSQARWRTSYAERLASYGRQYKYAAVIDYNLPTGVRWSAKHRQYVTSKPARTTKGGGIFLHVNGRGATAGCVSLQEADMAKVLAWLRPGSKPRIVMGPKSVIRQM